MSHRLEKFASTLHRAVQQVISRGLHDPRAGGLISVTKVDVSPDLANAIVFVSVVPEEKQNLTLHALRHAARHIRREAGELMAAKRIPELDFRVDESLKAQAEVFDALARARAATPPASDAATPGDEGGSDGAPGGEATP